MDDMVNLNPTMLTAIMTEEMAFEPTTTVPFLTSPLPEDNMSVLLPTNMTMTCNYDLRLVDVAEFDYPYRKETWIPITWREIFKIVAYIIAFLISLAGNMLVILVVYYNTHMRTSTNQYLVNLAVADLLVTLVCMWVHIVRHLSHPNFVLPALVCKLDSFVQATSMLASVLTLTVISVGRFLAVMFPLQARTSPDRAHRVIAAVWITSALLACPTLFYRQLYSIKWANFTSWQCDEIWPSESKFDPQLGYCVKMYDSKKLFYTAFTIALYFLPVAIMIVNYSLVVWRLWMTQLPGEHSAPARNTATRAKKKVVKMVSVVLVVFVLCWTPLQSIILYTSFVHGTHNSLPSWFSSMEFSAYFVAYSNSALNPIIYCGFNANFRQGLVSLLTCRHSSSGRIYHRRNWKGMTGGTRETTVGCSGPEPAILLEVNSTKKSRFVPRIGRSLTSSTGGGGEVQNSISDSGSDPVSKMSVHNETVNENQSSSNKDLNQPKETKKKNLSGRSLKSFGSRGFLGGLTNPGRRFPGTSSSSFPPFGNSQGVVGCCGNCRRKGRRKKTTSVSTERQIYGMREVRDNVSNDTKEDML